VAGLWYCRSGNCITDFSATRKLLCGHEAVLEGALTAMEALMARKTKKSSKTAKRRLYSNEDLKTLKAHSKAKTPVDKIAKLMKRSGPTLRQKARALGLSLGHRR
jgi:hypothetical protein